MNALAFPSRASEGSPYSLEGMHAYVYVCMHTYNFLRPSLAQCPGLNEIAYLAQDELSSCDPLASTSLVLG